MKTRSWRLLALALVLFFALQLVSDFLLPLGGVFTRAALVLRPLDGGANFDIACRLLGDREKDWEPAQMMRTLKLLDAAIRLNPLNFRIHFQRFRVLQRLEINGYDESDAAAAAMKHTLLLRWKDPEIGMSGVRFALSRWPLLSMVEKSFYRTILLNMVESINYRYFQRILNTWGLYSRDMSILLAVMERRPEFNLYAAQTLAQLQIHPDVRIQFLARYEAWAVGHFKELLQETKREPHEGFESMRKMADLLGKAVEGYSVLVSESSNTNKQFVRVMDELQLKMVAVLTGSMEWTRRTSSRKQILRLVWKMLERPANRSALKQLKARLENTRFFAQSDLEILELRMRLLLGIGDFKEVSLLGAVQVEQRHYVPPAEAAIVRRILILHARALERLGKVDAALRVVSIARERTGGDPSLHWMDFRLKNPGDLEQTHQAWRNLPEEIRLSHVIPLPRVRIVRTVYPPPWNQVVVQVPKDNSYWLSNAHLVQVWVNEKILGERYARDLEPGSDWRISLPEKPRKEPLNVEVRIK